MKGKLSSLRYYCKSLFPPRSIHQQTFLKLQNVPPQKFHSKKYRSVRRLFIAKFAEFQKCRMFICIIFYSGKFHKLECRLFIAEFAEFQNVHWQNISQQNPRNAKCSSAEYFVAESQRCRMFIGKTFHSKILEMQNVHQQNISQWKVSKDKVRILRQTVHSRIC